MVKRAPFAVIWSILFFVVLPGLFNSCQFSRNNPNDIGSSDYVGVSILRPGEGAAVTTDTVIATWQGQGEIADFNYRLDNSEWTSTGTQTSAVLRHLEEGAHFLEVRATNKKSKDSTAAVNFTVNALSGPSLLISPQITIVSATDTAVSVSVNLDEVYQVLGVNAVLAFNHARLAYLRSASAWTLFADTLGPDTLELSAACLDSANGFSGSGRLATLTFKPISVITPADIVFIAARTKLTTIGGGTTQFRNLRKGSVSQ